MSVFQIASVLFALFMIYVLSIHSKKNILSRVEQSFWYSTWGVFIVIAVFPNLVQGLAGSLLFARVFDLLVVLAFVVLTTMAFSNYFANKILQKKIEDVVRQATFEALPDEGSQTPSRKKKKSAS